MRLAFLRLAVVAVLFSCGSCGRLAVPGELPSSLVPLTCGPGDARCVPLVVDRPADERNALTVAMKNGVAVVIADGHSFRLLPDCTAGGQYGFMRLPREDHAEQLSDVQTVGANLPSLAVLFGATIQAEYEHGAALDLAWEVVGSRRSQLKTVTRDRLQGSCSGATHYVRSADIGEFSIRRGTRGVVRTAAQILGASGSASASSSSNIESAAGSVDVCKDYGGRQDDDGEPPVDCAAPVRIELAAIPGEGAPPATPDVLDRAPVQCPAGYVRAGGICAKAADRASHACDGSDVADCDAQCDRGDAESCTRAGAMHARGAEPASPQVRRALELFTKACRADNGWGCDQLGVLQAFGLGTEKDTAAAGRSFQRACELGFAGACGQLGRLFRLYDSGVGHDLPRAARYFSRGCSGGDPLSCSWLAQMLVGGVGIPRDVPRGAVLAKNACEGGEGSGCTTVGYALESGVAGAVDVVAATQYYARAGKTGDSLGFLALGNFFEAGFPATPDHHAEPRNDQSARALYEQAYDQSASSPETVGVSVLAAAILDVAYQDKRPVDFRSAQELIDDLIDACAGGIGRACGYAGIIGVAGHAGDLGAKDVKRGCALKDNWSCFEIKRLRLP